MDIRIGQGYDIHRLQKDLPLYLGGVLVPHTHGLDGHSDADVLLHAIADACLGAAGLQDIGTYFVNTDERWSGISSVTILRETGRLVKEAGWEPVNIDATVIAEAPKIGGLISAMKDIIGEALGISSSAVGIKATTNERLGSIGRYEGIAAMAVALVKKA